MVNDLGIVILIFGILGAVFPYRLARFEERVDAIGSKRSWEEVEPAEWKVLLTRVVGALLGVVGFVVMFAE